MKKVCICTLGCRVNQYESVSIGEALQKKGFLVTKDEEDCDYYLLNTCSVTGESQRQSRQLARRFASRGKVAVIGCASQNQKEDFLSIPGVFYVGGCANKLAVADAIAEDRGGDLVTSMEKLPYEPMSVSGTCELFSTCRAYLKIQDGCSGKCTYCIIPTLRGKTRSRNGEEIFEEATRLVKAGYREIVLTGIETSAYNKLPLWDLISRLGDLEPLGLARVRLGSLSIGSLTPAFFEAMKNTPNFMPHLHLSIQSGSTEILRLMKRPYTAESAMERILSLKEALPHVQLSGDFITGFPRETEEDYLATERFVQESGMMHVHAFPYSERAGTPAAEMEGSVPKEIRKARCARLNAVSALQKKQIMDTFTGKIVKVLTEKIKNGVAIGHTEEFMECTFPAESTAVGRVTEVAVSGNENGRLMGNERK